MTTLFKSKLKVVQQIHNEFDEAADLLIEQANKVIDDKQQRLKNLGFTNAEGVENLDGHEFSLYYQTKYPLLKFITEATLDRICKKYGLVYKPVENFTGNVPLKNISEMELVQVRDDTDKPADKIWCELKRDNSFFLVSGNGGGWSGIWGSDWYKIPKLINGEHFTSQFSANDYLRKELGFTTDYLVRSIKNCTQHRGGLFICAPSTQFKGNDKSISFFEVKDPIVFRFVKGGVQIISKWGLEASDNALVNEINN